jgi:hypothetical protein
MLVIGAQWYPADGDAARRQQRSRDALAQASGVLPVNLQFADEAETFAGTRLAAVLRRDSRDVTGRSGRRKPIVPDMIDALAAVAAVSGATWCALINADIEVTQAAVDRILGSVSMDGFAFSRLDIDPHTRAPLAVQIYGIDMIAVRVAWWRAHRHRFRAYIAGEACWDNVYAAILASHGAGDIISDAPGILHERHEHAGMTSGPFAEYNGYLAALDAPYFSRWVAYARRIEAMQASGAPLDHARVVREVFAAPPRWSAVHVLRQARARVRFASRRFASRWRQ